MILIIDSPGRHARRVRDHRVERSLSLRDPRRLGSARGNDRESQGEMPFLVINFRHWCWQSSRFSPFNSSFDLRGVIYRAIGTSFIRQRLTVFDNGSAKFLARKLLNLVANAFVEIYATRVNFILSEEPRNFTRRGVMLFAGRLTPPSLALYNRGPVTFHAIGSSSVPP